MSNRPPHDYKSPHDSPRGPAAGKRATNAAHQPARGTGNSYRMQAHPELPNIPTTPNDPPLPPYAPHPWDGNGRQTNEPAEENNLELEQPPDREEFSNLVNALTEVHERQVQDLYAANVALKKRLDTLVSATWRMGKDGWHGAAHEPEFGALTLSCDNKRKNGFKWRVSETTLMQCDKTINFRVREIWHAALYGEEDVPKPRASLMSAASPLPRHSIMHSSTSMEDLEIAGDGCARFITTPTSNPRLGWDIAGMVLLAYDMIMIPIFFFHPEENWFIVLMEWLTLIFWTADIAASLMTGFVQDGKIVMVPGAIAKNYMQTWMLPDLVVLGPDWVVNIMKLVSPGDEGGEAGITGLLRALRVIRCLRLLRLAKLRRALNRLKDHITSEVVFIMVAFAQLTLAMLFMNHFLGSVFYMIGDVGKSGQESTWIERQGLEDKSLEFRYTTSVHWSISKFSLGSNLNVAMPRTSGEMWFDVFVMVAGMSMFALFVGNCTNWLSQLHNMNGEFAKQTWLLRRYLRQNSVDHDLKTRILRYLEYKNQTERDTVTESRLQILGSLSENLYRELQFKVGFAPLKTHPLFDHLEGMGGNVVYGFVGKVINVKSYAKFDTVFKKSLLAPCLYCVAAGEVVYVHAESSRDARLSKGDWLCEATLWVSWSSLGELHAVSDCEMILVDAKAFSNVMQENEDMLQMMAHYGKVFVKWLNRVPHNRLSDMYLGDEGLTIDHARSKVYHFIDEAATSVANEDT